MNPEKKKKKEREREREEKKLRNRWERQMSSRFLM
jgi:hypothetical protein